MSYKIFSFEPHRIESQFFSIRRLLDDRVQTTGSLRALGT